MPKIVKRKPAAKPMPKASKKPTVRPPIKPASKGKGKQATPTARKVRRVPVAAAKRASKPPAKPANRPKPKPPADDPFDTKPSPHLDMKPTPPYPGVYYGIHRKLFSRSAIAYKRTETQVFTVMFDCGKRVLVRWGVDDFDFNMRRCRYPHLSGPVYPLELALKTYLQSNAIYDDGAWRVLNKLAQGKDPDVADELGDILDMKPSSIQRARTRRTRTPAARLERKQKRQARLAAMTPVQQRAWKDKRNTRRKLRRLAKKGGK